MKIILLKDVKKLGKKYEVKEVADGHALNMLIPNGLALVATPGNINMIDIKKKSDVFQTVKTEAELQKALNEIQGISIIMTGKVNDKGHLFAGIHKEEIIEAVRKQKGVNLPPEHLGLEKPLKEVGEHTIKVTVNGRETTFKLVIKAE
jgi:large subunit ribosomal protein L9